MSDAIAIKINGQSFSVSPSTTVAAAIARAGVTKFRDSVQHQPRAPICGMGVCFECRVSINGQPNLRSCNLLCSEGMEVRTDV